MAYVYGTYKLLAKSEMGKVSVPDNIDRKFCAPIVPAMAINKPQPIHFVERAERTGIPPR